MKTIELNDGTIIENAECLYDDTYLYIYISGTDLITGVTIFSNADNNAKITARDGDKLLRVYEGYTRLFAVNGEFGNCNLTLKKG